MKGLRLLPFAALAVLGACDFFDRFGPEAPPAALPPEAVAPSPGPSETSRALAAFYNEVQADLLSQGLLRRDGGGASAPFGARDLAQDFVRIALYDEYSNVGGRLVARAHPSTLRRWERPIRMSVEFGPSVPPERRRQDLREIQEYAARLTSLTGRPITIGTGAPNFLVLVVNEDERLAYGPRIQALVPGISPAALRSIVELPQSTFCLVHAFSSPDQSSAFTAAVAVIRAEHPDLMRLSCIHEELAQGMGLANDSPSARPSIFNDDEEFALLTPHDEMLLRMLYDPRLSVGMTEAEAAPIAQAIALEYFGGDG